MNYYEELGISADANDEEIRRAHRRLTRLLHPDQQMDEAMRRLAETQMRRLNGIIEVLTDSEHRRLYDQQIKQRVPHTPLGHVAQHSLLPLRRHGFEFARAWHALPWWIWTTVGALVLTSAAVWFYADNLGSSFGNRAMAYNPSRTTVRDTTDATSSQAEHQRDNPFEALTSRLRKAFQAQLQAGAEDLRRQELQASRMLPAGPVGNKGAFPYNADSASPVHAEKDAGPEPEPQVTKDTRSVAKSTARTGVAPARMANTAPGVPAALNRLAMTKEFRNPAPGVPAVVAVSAPKLPMASAGSETIAKVLPSAVQPPPATGAIPGPRDAIEGDWIYAPNEPEKRKAGLYPPDFIRLSIFRSEGHLRGEYTARYEITDNRALSPDVSFSLAQSRPNDARRFVWESDNGSKGTFRIKSVSEATIRVEWQTTVASSTPGLTSGVAVLVRK